MISEPKTVLCPKIGENVDVVVNYASYQENRRGSVKTHRRYCGHGDCSGSQQCGVSVPSGGGFTLDWGKCPIEAHFKNL
jgi:hypothetical protein